MDRYIIVNNKRENTVIFLGIVLFGLSDFFRFSLFEKINLNSIPYIANINVIAIIIVLYMLIKKRIVIIDSIQILILLLFITLSFISFININSQKHLIPLYIFNLIFPLILLNSRFYKVDSKFLVKIVLKVYNTWIITIIIFGMMDYITGGMINQWLSQNFYSENMIKLTSSIYNNYYRLSTPWGTSLFNGFLVLVFLVLNSINILMFESKNSTKLYGVYFITFIGVILTGSKACLICSVFYILITTFYENRNLIKIISVLSVFIIIFNTQFFQTNIWTRIVDQHVTGTLSSGRHELMSFIFEDKVETPKFIIGQGSGYSRIVSTNLNQIYRTATNFEYPIIMLSYDYGILCTVLYFVLALVIPMIKMIKSNNNILAISIFTIFIYLNTFNGIAEVNYDFNYKYVFLIMLFYSISNIRVKEYNK